MSYNYKTKFAELLLLFSSVILSLFVSEFALRVLKLENKPRSFVEYHEILGWWPRKELCESYHTGEHFVSKMTTNSWGMRDEERRLTKNDKTVRIACLGDSFLFGRALNDNEHLVAVMNEKSPNNIEFLNFGVESYSITQSYLTYTTFARHFNPDIVILFFYTLNDVAETSEEIETIHHAGAKVNAPYYHFVGGDLELSNVTDDNHKDYDSSKRLIWDNIHLARLAIRVKNSIISRFIQADKDNDAQELANRIYFDIYRTEPDKLWKDAWKIVLMNIEMLNRSVTKAGAQLLIVVIPDQVELNQDIKKAINDVYGITLQKYEYDQDYPFSILRRFAEEHNIDILWLKPPFENYLRKNSLTTHALYFPIDRHFTVLGSTLAAESIKKYLDVSLVKAAMREKKKHVTD